MPKAKTTKQPDNNSPFDRSGAGIRAALLFTVVAFLTIALVVVWKQLPKQEESKPKPPVVSNQEKRACESKGGRWVECASPCAPGEICAQVCVAKCMMPETATSTPPQVEPEPEPATPVRERPAGMLCDDRNFICVDPAFAENTLPSPFIVSGSGIAFENTINWRLLDGNGAVLESGHVLADAPDVGRPGDFEIRAFMLSVPKTSTGTLEVLEYSAKDGSPIHVVSVPVTFGTQTMATRFFLSPKVVGNDCSVVESVQATVPRSSLPVETALRALLKLGPAVETNFSAIAKDASLVSLKVSAGTATVVINRGLLGYDGGSCNVQMIRSQIEQTLKQFSSVNTVILSEEGKTPEESFQP